MLTVKEVVKELNRYIEEGKGDYLVTIRTNQPGALSGNRTIAINGVSFGIDWESKQLIIIPVKEITETGSTVGFNNFYNLLTQPRLFLLEPSRRYMVRYLKNMLIK